MPAKVRLNLYNTQHVTGVIVKRGVLVGIALGFFVVNIAGVCLRCLFPLTDRPAYNAGRAWKVEPLPTFTMAVAQLLQGMFPYCLECPRQDPGNNCRQCTGCMETSLISQNSMYKHMTNTLFIVSLSLSSTNT